MTQTLEDQMLDVYSLVNELRSLEARLRATMDSTLDTLKGDTTE